MIERLSSYCFSLNIFFQIEKFFQVLYFLKKSKFFNWSYNRAYLSHYYNEIKTDELCEKNVSPRALIVMNYFFYGSILCFL